MTELEQLEHAIVALEAQRALLGDAVIDAALAPMREKLAALRAQASPAEPKRIQATVLFADVSGFTALSETLDAEELTELMNALWQQLDATIAAHNGSIDKHIGDAVMAVWGVDSVREDDPECATHAALEMQAALAAFREARALKLAMRIGINTGPVLLGEIGSLHEFTVMGDTVNLASRMEHAAPVGGILITHNTYRHVRGVFDVLPQAPLVVKGKVEPVQTYIVQRVKPHAFRTGTRGVEGVETRMVGREAELLALQRALEHTIDAVESRSVIVVGEAGVGKSRLLYEFEHWLERRPQRIDVLKGRATPSLQVAPYRILRDMFSYRFDILENDSAAVALEKFRAGMAGVLAPERADLVGQLVGFDFTSSPAVQGLLGSRDFSEQARADLLTYLRAAAERQPTVIVLEDLHWADDSSLDLIEHLGTVIPRARLLLVGLARPTYLERRPVAGGGPPGRQLLVLQLLSKEASRALVDDILRKVEALPDALRELIVERAEGNPLFVEEMIKMLIEEGGIERGADAQSAWRVSHERLNQLRVPPTLTSLLEARLDSLPREEREPLQRAAVVGRMFWDAAVAELIDAGQEDVRAAFDAIRARELIFRRERSAFASTQEYLFKHALLRDVTYETVLLKLRRVYHAQVAHWLELHAGERIGEYTALIAEHLECAGQAEQAASYLRQAGVRALGTGAFREALGFSRRALDLLPTHSRERAGLLVHAGEALMKLGDYEEARRQFEAALALADQCGDDESRVDALLYLGGVALAQGDRAQSRTHIEDCIALARQLNDQPRIAHSLYRLGWVELRQGEYAPAELHLSESKALYTALGDRRQLANVLNALGIVALDMNETGQATALLQQSLALARATGSRRSEATVLSNLGEIAREQGDYATARQYYQEALELTCEMGHVHGQGVDLLNLGHVSAEMEDYDVASTYYRRALQLAMDIQALPIALECLAGWARVAAHTGQPLCAIRALGAVVSHPALDRDGRSIAERALDDLRTRLSLEAVEAGLECGKGLSLEAVAAELLETGSLAC